MIKKILICFLTALILNTDLSNAETRQGNSRNGDVRIYNLPIPKGTPLSMTLCCNTRTYISATSKSEPSVEDSGTDFSQVAYTTPGTKFSFRDYNDELLEYECDPSSYGKCETTNTGRAMVRMTALDLVVRCTNKSPVNKMLEPQGKIQLSMESGSIELQDIWQKLSCDSKQRGVQDASKGVQLTKEKKSKAETVDKVDTPEINLMCMTRSCEYSTSGGYKSPCVGRVDNSKYSFKSNTHVSNELPLPEKLDDGAIKTYLENTDIASDSKFYFYIKYKTTGHTLINSATHVVKVSIDRLTGGYYRLEHQSTVYNEGNQDWRTYEFNGSCIPEDSIKDIRKF